MTRCVPFLGALTTLLLLGCAAHDPPAFSFAGTNLVWPASPDPPRIRYIGEIRGEASLGRKRDAAALLREAITGPAATAGFSTPMAVAVEGMRVYVADPSHPQGPTVHALDLAAKTYAAIRDAGGRKLQWPLDVSVRDGVLAIADAKRAEVILRRDGQDDRVIGAGRLLRPVAVEWIAADELGALDAVAHALLRFDAAGGVRQRVGGRGAAAGEMNFPAGLGVSRFGEPMLGVADSMNFRVQMFDARGDVLAVFGRKGDAAGDFALPRDVAFDSLRHVYVLDSQFENVQVFDGTGRLLLAFGGEGGGPGRFSVPSGITIDAADRIWIADTYNRRVQVFQFIREEVQ